MRDDRLRRVLEQARASAPPRVACDLHLPLFEAAQPDLDAVEAALDCDDCRAALDAHPYLDPTYLDLPVPPPRVRYQARAPARRSRWPWAVGALAAALLLSTLRAPDRRLGPTHEGSTGYAWVEPQDRRPGPSHGGSSGYAWVERQDRRPGPTHEGSSGYAWVEPPPRRPGVDVDPSAPPGSPGEFQYLAAHEEQPSFWYTGMHDG